MSEKTDIDLTVTEHNDREKAGKEAVYTVVLETAPTHDPKVRLSIKTCQANLFEVYPLERTITVSLSRKQRTLDETE